MIYIRADENHNVIEWPISEFRLRRMYNLPEDLSEVKLSDFGIYAVEVIEPPKADLHHHVGLNVPVWDESKQEFLRTFQQMKHTDEEIEKHWRKVRTGRTNLLARTDWTQLPDADLTKEQKDAWSVYRQALRDVTKFPDPFQIEWPKREGVIAHGK